MAKEMNKEILFQKYSLLTILQIGILLCLPFASVAYASTSEGSSTANEKLPTTVRIAIELHQIVSINQREENFQGVVTSHIHYHDPVLAYDRKPGDPEFRMYHLSNFIKLLQEKGTSWPEMIVDNQQGRRLSSTLLITLSPDGSVRYFERATITFQTPDMDFRRFPFDKQEFEIKLTSVFPNDMYVFEELPYISRVGNALGEEEWVVYDVNTTVTDVLGRDDLERSRFSLTFKAHRHVTYYVVRIFIPLIIILLVTWFTFLLKDYVKRVDVGITTLLLFIAFNFAVSRDLPRLGYVTAMDAFLTGTFIITGVVLLVNVMFRRLQTSGREQLVERIDRYAILGYWPAYILGMSVTFLWL